MPSHLRVRGSDSDGGSSGGGVYFILPLMCCLFCACFFLTLNTTFILENVIQQENFAKMVPTHTSNADFEHRISDLKPKLDKVVKLHSKVRMQVDELRVGTQARDTHMASIGHLKQEQEQEHELVRHLEVQQKGIENLKKQLLLSNNVLQRLQGK